MANHAEPILLDGNSLTRDHVVAIARDGAHGRARRRRSSMRVQRAADFLADKVSCGEPIYGVTTGFGSNADKLLGAHRARDELPGGNPEHARDGTLLEELQHNLSSRTRCASASRSRPTSCARCWRSASTR